MPDDKKKQPKKSNLWKYLVGCGALVVVLGIAGIVGLVVLGMKSITTDPVKAKAIASSFLDFEVPQGYKMKFAMNLVFMKMAAFSRETDEDNGLTTILAYFSKSVGSDRAQMESQMNQQLEKQGGKKKYKVEDRDETTVTVRGEDVKATRARLVEEGSDKEMRQFTFFLDAKGGGTVMVLIQGPEDDFDSDAMDDFLDSIK